MNKKKLTKVCLVLIFLLISSIYCNNSTILNAKGYIFVNGILDKMSVYTSFENSTINSGYSRTRWQEDGFNPNNWDNGLNNRTKVTDEEAYGGDDSLEVVYPAGKYGSQETGTQVELKLIPEKEYYASYRVKFGSGFSWGSESKGGKLPGLTGGERCGTDYVCDGTDGFSARYMWRHDGYPELYLYSADMENEQYGDDIPFIMYGEPVQFETEKWYTITERVKLNSTPTSDDGIVEIWLNGTLVVDLHDITFVTDNQLIDTFYFSTFHGGHGAEWAPENDSYAYFDDLKISPCACGVDY